MAQPTERARHRAWARFSTTVKRYDPAGSAHGPAAGRWLHYRPFAPAAWRRIVTGKRGRPGGSRPHLLQACGSADEVAERSAAECGLKVCRAASSAPLNRHAGSSRQCDRIQRPSISSRLGSTWRTTSLRPIELWPL